MRNTSLVPTYQLSFARYPSMRLDQRLVDAAIAQAVARFGGRDDAGAAALYTADGRILTSVCLESPNESANLCHETGAICEAYRLGLRVTASVCVSRTTQSDAFIILSPCGICQERLAIWGPVVEVAVPQADDPTGWQAKTLKEVQPYYWGNVYRTEQ
jgi:cytidine deaminase